MEVNVTTNTDYHFNLFRPGTEYGRKNRNIIISMIIMWVIAVFGFQILLRILEKPTPEKALTQFQGVWENVKSGTASPDQSREFVQSLVYVAGKLTVKPAERNIVDAALSSVFFTLLPEEERIGLIAEINTMKQAQEKLKKVEDQEYLDLQMKVQENQQLIAEVCSKYSGFDPGSVENRVLSFHIIPVENPGDLGKLSPKLPDVMNHYLIHYQSVLTDFIFLGFPFHYFYTAEFLLFLFILFCLIYTIRIERLNRIYSIPE